MSKDNYFQNRIEHLEEKIKNLESGMFAFDERIKELEKLKNPTIIAAASPLNPLGQMLGLAGKLMENPEVLKDFQKLAQKELEKKLKEQE